MILAAANTWGRGGDQQYVGRNQLDAATLDRFVLSTLHVDYDTDLERDIAQARCSAESRPRPAGLGRTAPRGDHPQPAPPRRLHPPGGQRRQGAARRARSLDQVKARYFQDWSADEQAKVSVSLKEVTTMNSRLIPARFAGKCRTCGKAVAKGEPVYFAKHYGVRCAACGPHTADDQPLPPKKGSKRFSVQARCLTTPRQATSRKKRPGGKIGCRVHQPAGDAAEIRPDLHPGRRDTRLTAEAGPDGIHRLMFESVTDLVEDAFTDWAVTDESRDRFAQMQALRHEDAPGRTATTKSLRDMR